MREFLEKIWYARHPAAVFLTPLCWLYRLVVWLRRRAYSSGLLSRYRAPVPVIVVGNVTLGGTGKTPLVIWLAQYLQANGYKPGIISRGYLGGAKRWPQQVRADSDPAMVGDEAVVIARRTELPVAVGPRRADNVQALLQHADCDIIVSDDGLQHYHLNRDVEILLVDGIRRFGNGMCLPAGPLREPLSRLRDVDLIVTNGVAGRGEFRMRTKATHLHSLQNSVAPLPLDEFAGKSVNAVAGIGHPQRFFDLLRASGLRVIKHPFPDHHLFQSSELQFEQHLPIVMTEKDAVKCERFKLSNAWYLPMDIELPEVFEHRLNAVIGELKSG